MRDKIIHNNLANINSNYAFIEKTHIESIKVKITRALKCFNVAWVTNNCFCQGK